MRKLEQHASGLRFYVRQVVTEDRVIQGADAKYIRETCYETVHAYEELSLGEWSGHDAANDRPSFHVYCSLAVEPVWEK